MRRLLLITVFAFVAMAAGGRGAAAAVSDADKRCELGDEQLSLLSETRFASLREAVVQVNERCVAGLGNQADCQMSDTNGAPGPGGSWAPPASNYFVIAGAVWLAPASGRVVGAPERAVVLCDGYARELERPPQG